jgi:hypothetical protein
MKHRAKKNVTVQEKRENRERRMLYNEGLLELQSLNVGSKKYV